MLKKYYIYSLSLQVEWKYIGTIFVITSKNMKFIIVFPKLLKINVIYFKCFHKIRNKIIGMIIKTFQFSEICCVYIEVIIK